MARETAIVLIGLAIAILGILLLRVGRQIARFLLALGGLGVIGTVAYALVAQATATCQAAQAATVASVGQTAGSITTTILAVLLIAVVLAALTGGGYLAFRLRRAERRLGARRWTPGPNAHWGQLEQRGEGAGEQLQQTMQQMLLLEMLRVLRDLRRLQYPPVVYGGSALNALDDSDVYALLDDSGGESWW